MLVNDRYVKVSGKIQRFELRKVWNEEIKHKRKENLRLNETGDDVQRRRMGLRGAVICLHPAAGGKSSQALPFSLSLRCQKKGVAFFMKKIIWQSNN